MTETVKPKTPDHDTAPSIVVNHKFSPIGEWYTLCKYCRLAQAAHAQNDDDR